MRQVVESFLTYRHIENAPVDLAVVATDLATGKPVVLDSGDVTTALHSKKRSPWERAHLYPPDGALAGRTAACPKMVARSD
ncbi:MAG: hypothetical protein ABSH29_15020 [Acidimicrobiales bacterium]|jgi:hypothetical protein